MWVQIGRLLKDRPLDRDELREYFVEAGYDAATLPALDFDAAIGAFEAAFVEVVDGEKELQGIIQIGQLRRQTGIQTETLAKVTELVAAVGELTGVMVRAGQVWAEGSARPVYQWRIGKFVGRDEIHDAANVLSGDLRQSIITLTTNYFGAGADPHYHDTDQFEAALQRYLGWVDLTYGKLTLRGLKEREAGRITLDLDEIYTSLEVEVDPETDEHKRRWARRSRPGEGEPLEGGRETKDMAQLLALDNRLVITGGPGSGKTTYLHLIASSIACALVSGNGEPVERVLGLRGVLPLPVVVSLAGYNKYRRERQGNLIDYISHAIIEKNGALGLPVDFFSRLLIQGRSCFVLLDGLDEIANDGERAIVRGLVQTFANNAGIGRLIVTSRTRAYKDQSVFPYRLAIVKPMTPEQVNVLAGKWCDAAYGPDERTRQRDSLRREIEQLETLRAARSQPRLIDTPLLVTIVAIVHDNLNTLPQERAELYEECVKALLSEGYHAPTDEHLDLVERGGKFNEKRNILAQLAFEMMGATDKRRPKEERARTTVQEQQLLKWLRPLVVKVRGEEKANSWLAEFTEVMRERGSLLDERDGEYRFTHLTFQEFLAASYLGDTISEADDIVSQLIQRGRVADSWWRETVLLTAGYIALRSPDRALRLLNRLASVTALAGGDVESALSAAELAGVSFLEIGSHDKATCWAIAERLKDLLLDETLTVPNPLRAAAGRALGRLGDPREGVIASVPVTVAIPPGEFIMGSERRRDQPGYDDLSQRKAEATPEGTRFVVTLPAYRIGKYPVTVAQFRRFVDDHGYATEKYWTPAGWQRRQEGGWVAPRLWDDPEWTIDNHPVAGVSWYEAVAYGNWLTATNPGRFFRLPDEAMWEKAARGTDGRRWPWGNDWDLAKLNSDTGGIGRTSAVGIFPAGSRLVNAAGERIYDCAGNVMEWCSGPGARVAPYPFKQRSYLEDLQLDPPYRAMRGGSWLHLNQASRAAYRYYNMPHFRHKSVGFRVVELLSDPDS